MFNILNLDVINVFIEYYISVFIYLSTIPTNWLNIHLWYKLKHLKEITLYWYYKFVFFMFNQNSNGDCCKHQNLTNVFKKG